MVTKTRSRSRILAYLALAVVLVGWFLVTDYLDRERQEKIAALREMHRLGRGPDIDAILSDPQLRRQKRLQNGALLLVGAIVAVEWRLRLQRRAEESARTSSFRADPTGKQSR